jgi:hypothetical protein
MTPLWIIAEMLFKTNRPFSRYPFTFVAGARDPVSTSILQRGELQKDARSAEKINA